MVMSVKTQCRSCKEWGRVKGLHDWCCKAIDENDRIHYDRIARRSNCWCLDQVPNDRPFKMTQFHVIGKYFTEHYGTNVKLTPISLKKTGETNVESATEFRVEIDSPLLKQPFSAEFSVIGKDGMKTYMGVMEEVCKYERYTTKD